MKAKMNVQFNPEETPISDIERKLKFLDDLPIIIDVKNSYLPGKIKDFEKGFNIVFNHKNNVDIIPAGDVVLAYSNIEKIPRLEKCTVSCDDTCLYIYDNTVNTPDSYCFFYRGEKNENS